MTIVIYVKKMLRKINTKRGQSDDDYLIVGMFFIGHTHEEIA